MSKQVRESMKAREADRTGIIRKAADGAALAGKNPPGNVEL
jgi:hypothetical protein